LTTERGGIFTPEEAADFYRASLLDVAELSFQALAQLNQAAQANPHIDDPDRYDFVVSCSPEEDQKILETIFNENGPWLQPILYIQRSW